jgi:hypothetical protein
VLRAGRGTISTILCSILDHHLGGRRCHRCDADLDPCDAREPAMTELMVAVAGLMPLDVLPHPPSPSPTGVYPQQGQGFAAYFVGGFMALGLLLLIMVLLRLRPKRRDRRPPDH